MRVTGTRERETQDRVIADSRGSERASREVRQMQEIRGKKAPDARQPIKRWDKGGQRGRRGKGLLYWSQEADGERREASQVNEGQGSVTAPTQPLNRVSGGRRLNFTADAGSRLHIPAPIISDCCLDSCQKRLPTRGVLRERERESCATAHMLTSDANRTRRDHPYSAALLRKKLLYRLYRLLQAARDGSSVFIIETSG